MSTHNIGFYEEISKIITYHQISSNTHLISSADNEDRSDWENVLADLYVILLFLPCHGSYRYYHTTKQAKQEKAL